LIDSSGMALTHESTRKLAYKAGDSILERSHVSKGSYMRQSTWDSLSRFGRRTDSLGPQPKDSVRVRGSHGSRAQFSGQHLSGLGRRPQWTGPDGPFDVRLVQALDRSLARRDHAGDGCRFAHFKVFNPNVGPWSFESPPG